MQSFARGAIETNPTGVHVSDERAKPEGLARGLSLSYLTLALTVAVSFLTTPLLLHGLGTAGFALFVLCQTLVGYLGLIELGTGTATLRRVAAAFASDDGPRVQVLVGSNLLANTAFSLVAVVATTVLALTFDLFVTTGSEESRAAPIVIGLLGAVQIANFLSTGYTSLLFGGGRLGTNAVANGIINAAVSLTTAGVALGGGGPTGVAITSLLATAVGTLNLRRLTRKYFPDIIASPSSGSWSTVKELLRSGANNVVIAVGAILANGIDIVIVAVFLDADLVASYAVATRAVTVARLLSTRAADGLVPSFARAHASGDLKAERDILSDSIVGSMAVAVPLALCLTLLAGPLLAVWLPTVPTGSAGVLAILGLALITQTPGHCCYALLTSSERFSFLIGAGLLFGFLNLGLSIALVLTIGVQGPAISSLVAGICFELVLLPRHVTRVLRMRFADLVMSTYARHAPAAVVQGLLLLAIRLTPVPDLVRVCLAAPTVLVYWATFAVTLSPAQRRRLLGPIRSRVPFGEPRGVPGS